MSIHKLKTISYCVGQKHYSGTKNIVGEIMFDRKTGRDMKLLVGQCSICNREKSQIVSDNIIQAEVLGDFFKNLGKKGLNFSKRSNKFSNKDSRCSKNPKMTLSTIPELIIFFKTGKDLYLRKFV